MQPSATVWFACAMCSHLHAHGRRARACQGGVPLKSHVRLGPACAWGDLAVQQPYNRLMGMRVVVLLPWKYVCLHGGASLPVASSRSPGLCPRYLPRFPGAPPGKQSCTEVMRRLLHLPHLPHLYTTSTVCDGLVGSKAGGGGGSQGRGCARAVARGAGLMIYLPMDASTSTCGTGWSEFDQVYMVHLPHEVVDEVVREMSEFGAFLHLSWVETHCRPATSRNRCSSHAHISHDNFGPGMTGVLSPAGPPHC